MQPAPTARSFASDDTLGRTLTGASNDVAEAARSPEVVDADICVIGAGSGGLAVAAAAAAVGQRVVIVEKNRMGGGSLNYGSVPSKALLAAARRAQDMRTAGAFGISPVHPAIDPEAVRAHVFGAMGSIAPNGSVERFTAMGIRIVPAAARFVDKATVEAGDLRIKARRYVIATGSSPEIPDIAGLENIGFFTNETIFDNARRLDRLVVLGGGSTALELALAHLRLGSSVAVIEPHAALADEDPELAAIAMRGLRAEGLEILEGTNVEKVEPIRQGVRLTLSSGGAIDATHVLIAGPRRPNISELNLAAAGIKFGPRGIAVNTALRTSNRRVFAIGDVTGAAHHTHAATYHANVFLKRALFRLRATQKPELAPRVTFTDPEIAWVGLSEAAARAKYKRINVLRSAFAENDRAQAEGATVGHIKVVTNDRGLILGAGIVGPLASELIQVWGLAVAQKLSIRDMAECVTAYPTFAQINQRVSAARFAAAAGSPLVRFLVRFLGRFG